MFKEKNLPLFEFVIDDTAEAGVKAVSIVGDPAFGSSLIAFEKEKPRFIALAGKKKQIVAGFSLIPNVPVYRIDPEAGEYLGFFSKETIEKIVEKYHAEMLSNRVNLEHDSNAYIDAFMVEDYIVDSDLKVQDLAAKGLSHPNALGAWYTAFKIKDEEVFNRIVKSGQGTGFSVEAFLDRVMVNFNQEIRNNLINKKVKNKMKKLNKSLKEKILAIFTEEEKFERELVPELAFEIEWTEVGAPVSKVIVNENGEETLQPVGQGEFVTEAGVVVVDEQSNLVEVRELPEEPEVEEPVVDEPEVEIELPEVSGTTGTTGTTETMVDEPEVPIVTGQTGTTGTTDTMGADMDACVADLIAQGKTEEEAWAICQSSVNGLSDCPECKKKGIEKTVLEVVGTQDGEYTILVKVEGGIVTSATAQSMTDLMFEKDKEITELKLKNEQLEEKIKEPIGDPILQPEAPAVDWNKMSAYEKMMHKKGMSPYYK